MVEELETQEEEILSMDMGQGSLHEIDETLAPEENGLQIVPWEIRDEIDSICKDPTKVPEIALLSSLKRMNFMNTHALDQNLIAAVRKKYAKGSEPWYPLTRCYLGRLVYDIQMTKEKEKRISNVKHDRIGKLLNIVDPNLGTDWLARVLSLKWGNDSWATLEKLNLIALQDAPVQNKIHWISLLEADKITRGAYGLKKGDHVFRIEGFLARVFERAFQIVSDLMDVPGVVPLPHDSTLTFYFEEIKFEARPFLFPIEVSLGAKTKDVEKQVLKKVDTLRMAAQRLSFRFLMFLVSKNVLPAMPFLARQWTQMATQDTCMYPSNSGWLLIMVSTAGKAIGKRSREDPSTSLDIDDEGDMPSRVNPFDD
ncbi:hypothetical protein GOP47_0007451 [Adiantum capillus-veneris]|uniref:Uncharacterized protein n=1 Tax=Adiantum capillus-veneris TaxID=13818 RepID=A0A9D4V1J6_ADICA|nr:hypothetical protein GOP47_0007451 [Adiantum capillus-veneris]